MPWRVTEGGVREVLLLTSRETGRWVIPKGWPMKARKPAKVAEIEAFEEAGLTGRIVGKGPIGSFLYEKQRPEGVWLCEVRVYSFRVDRQLADWPERRERTTRWFDANEAACLVDERGLARIITAFADMPMTVPPLRKPGRSARLALRLGAK